ncbi:MAG: Ca-activated chloride channel [Thermoleophilaceae bacterium]|nr:Ca-activated chloride channel [Thermoleophilaceae bacterium]
MSFAAPLVLLALVAVPLLALVYGRAERGRRAAAASFASPTLQPSVAPRRPGWRRHAPFLAMAIALAVLIVAAARPQRTVAVPVERASIMLATDVSGSMTATDVKPNRLAAAKRAGFQFLATVPAQVNVGVMAFNQVPQVLQSPTRDRQAVSAAIGRMSVHGGTATGEAINTATTILNRAPAGQKRPPAAIVLLSDGASTSGRDPVAAAQAAGKMKIPIYTVALGTQQGTIQVRRPQRLGGGVTTQRVPPDPRSLEQIARASGGRFFTAESASGLKAVYQRLGSQLGKKKEKRQVTSAVAGGGLLLLVGGVALSLGFFGRIV